jgi:hypothetical protein
VKMRCVMCGRQTDPSVMIGNEAVGPKCARRAGFFEKQPKGSAVRVVRRAIRSPKAKLPETMDLFSEDELTSTGVFVGH